MPCLRLLRRQGRRLAPGRRRLVDPTSPRLHRLRAALHHLRARRGGPAASSTKRSGDRVPFDRAKVAAGIRAAAKGRPVEADDGEAARRAGQRRRGRPAARGPGRRHLRGGRPGRARAAARGRPGGGRPLRQRLPRASTTSPTSSARSRCWPSAPSPSGRLAALVRRSRTQRPSSRPSPSRSRSRREAARGGRARGPTAARPAAPPTSSGDTVRAHSSTRSAASRSPLRRGPPSQVTTVDAPRRRARPGPPARSTSSSPATTTSATSATAPPAVRRRGVAGDHDRPRVRRPVNSADRRGRGRASGSPPRSWAPRPARGPAAPPAGRSVGRAGP